MLNEIRHAFEMRVRKDPGSVDAWTEYAQWEASKMKLQRSTAVWERAVAQNDQSPVLWLRYAQFVSDNFSTNDVRTVLDRAVESLPGNRQLSQSYVFMEESLGNVVGARSAFKRWAYHGLDEPGGLDFACFEQRHVLQAERARSVLERMVACHGTVEAWTVFAEFEESRGDQCSARNVYQRAVQALPGNEGILAAFRAFEERYRVRGEDGILGKRKLLCDEQVAMRNVKRVV